MFRSSQSIGGIYRLIQRVIVLIGIFTTSLGSMGKASPVQAAPPAQEVTNMRFYLNITRPTTLCARREYSIGVTPLVELNGKRADGQKFNYQDRILPGVEIVAEITDQNIATVDPAKPKSKRSGYLPDNPLGTTSLADQEKFGNLGEVVFKIKAKKAGSTNLYLTAKIPRQWSGGRDRYFGPQGMPTGGPIRVVNCKYELTLTYNWQYSFPTLNMGLTGTMYKVPLTVENEMLRGTGQVDFMRVLGGNPYCTYNLSTGKSTVDMTGSFSQDPSGSDQVKIAFNYGPMSEVIATTCTVPNFGTISGATDWSGPPVVEIPSVEFPDSGGTKSFIVTLNGRLTITLKPVPEQEGKQS